MNAIDAQRNVDEDPAIRQTDELVQIGVGVDFDAGENVRVERDQQCVAAKAIAGSRSVNPFVPSDVFEEMGPLCNVLRQEVIECPEVRRRKIDSTKKIVSAPPSRANIRADLSIAAPHEPAIDGLHHVGGCQPYRHAR